MKRQNRVLLIGNSKSVWVREIIKKIHVYAGNTVYVTDYYGLSDEEKDYYSSLEIPVSVIDVCHPNSILRMAKCCRQLIGFAKKNKGKIDLIDIQSPPHSIQAAIIERVIDILGARTIIAFWGSDILRINKKDARKMEGIIEKADCINIGTDQMQDALRNLFGNRFDDKCVKVAFGSPAVDHIRDCELSAEECKRYFGIDPERTSIAIGYNGREEQQHIPVIEQLSKLSQATKEKTEIIIHTGGSVNSAYLNQVEKSLKKSGIRYIILDKAYDLATIAKLRIATDILIHAQVTDAFSGSIRESVYAGSVLMNPTWIRYDRFDKDGVDYLQYDKFDKIPELVEGVISGRIVLDTGKNKELIYNGYSWESVRDKWTELLNA